MRPRSSRAVWLQHDDKLRLQAHRSVVEPPEKESPCANQLLIISIAYLSLTFDATITMHFCVVS